MDDTPVKTGRVRKKSAKVREMEEFEEAERKHLTKNVKSTPSETPKTSKVQQPPANVLLTSSKKKTPSKESPPAINQPTNTPPAVNQPMNTTPAVAKVKTASPTSVSRKKITVTERPASPAISNKSKPETKGSSVNVESSTKGQLAAKLKGQIMTPPKKQSVQFLVQTNKSPATSPTKSPEVSPAKSAGSPESKNKSSVIKLLLNQPAQSGSGAADTETTSPEVSSSKAVFTSPSISNKVTPKPAKPKKSMSFEAALESGSAATIAKSNLLKKSSKKAKKSQSVLAAALAAVPPAKSSDTEKDKASSGSSVKVGTDIPKLKGLLGTMEGTLPNKTGTHVVRSPRDSSKVSSLNQPLSIDTSMTPLSADKNKADSGLKMKFILSPNQKDSTTQSTVILSPNITGQTVSPAAKSQLTLEERLQQAAIGMKPKKSKKRKDSETGTSSSLVVGTSNVTASTKSSPQSSMTEIDLPPKKKLKMSKKLEDMHSTGSNTDIFVKPSKVDKLKAPVIKSEPVSDEEQQTSESNFSNLNSSTETQTLTDTVVKSEPYSMDFEDEESGLVIAEREPKPPKKLSIKKKMKSASKGLKSSSIPQSAMLKQVQSDHSVKVSDFSAIDKDHCQAMKKMEKVKKLKKDGKSEEGEKRLKKKKRPPTAYTMWCNQHRARIVSDNPGIDFATLSRRLGEIWQGLPAKEKLSWKRKAKRIANKVNKGSTMISTGKNKRVDLFHATKSAAAGGVPPLRQQPATPKAVRPSDEIMPSPVKGLGAEPVDVSAHLKLLGESLSIIGMRLQEHKGMIAVQGSLSVLLDSMLCACGPLVCLTSQVPELDGCSQQTHLNTLDNIAYYMPGL
ncbi:hypothetical protein ScPMuIL_001772 [Solemya velum]